MSKSVSYIGKFSDSGSKNCFYTVQNRKYGFKSFPNKELADFAYSVQKNLSEFDLTPKVYSVVGRIRVPNYFVKQDKNGDMTTVTQMVLSGWGYLTEIARPYLGHEYCNDHCGYEQSCVNYSKIQNIMDLMDEMGVGYTDPHNGNLGWVTRNKKRTLVIIDVGRESIGWVDALVYPDVEYYDDYDDDCDCSECAYNDGEMYV